MKPGVSSLNPYAAAYIPLSKREVDDRTYLTAKNSKSINETNWLGNPDIHNQQHFQASLECDARGMVKQLSQEAFTLKSHPAHGSYGASSQNVNEVAERIVDEEFDMDLEYLQMHFPGISDQSLTDVYLANKGDLGATIDMLSQLEFYTVESSETLPDTLDIGDVSEIGSSAHYASLKMKNVPGAADASSKASDSSVTS
ncbi:hypothetical protein FNV43_RR06866 [Rhamnella rubrinervis]|uniref:CUE domain-containing protein n=1 Tax=Rhamnella rubrinervis TaxID=2594499 RepID=A0A8K0HDU8_9ROSA|nr:hypothetical protein FNV43_RR06866 [Rhamnella rubrinervis]